MQRKRKTNNKTSKLNMDKPELRPDTQNKSHDNTIQT